MVIGSRVLVSVDLARRTASQDDRARAAAHKDMRLDSAGHLTLNDTPKR